MPTEVKKEIQLEIAHVLFIDIVGYSKLSVKEPPQADAVDLQFCQSSSANRAFTYRMKARDIDRATAASEPMELYCMAHPGSPSALRRPQLSVRSGTWVALLGLNVQDGIAGFGSSIEMALLAFDTQYLKALRPPTQAKAAKIPVKTRRPVSAKSRCGLVADRWNAEPLVLNPFQSL